ncbi:hypothetical protein AAC387_Pa10g1543 [Persea americana]|eukprot:TRINITY_DN539_c0_g1_i2.p1 TRINITY_DN539_c0_g1~~TRINITY_DN539_c0_g1_i2.p1  ORF type:complete len:782 (+),score=172.71 TRINITY_DN539_c0_g1_i2:281-2626(+)
MGAIDGIPKNESVYGQEVRSQLSPAPDLVDGFSRLGVDDSSLKDGRSLIQVMKAVEAAEYIIKHQFAENEHLKAELERQMRELEKYKSNGSTTLRSSADGSKDELVPEEDKIRWAENRSLDPHGAVVSHQAVMSNTGNSSLQTRVESHYHSENNKVNGILKALPSGQAGLDNAGLSQFSSPSSRSLSPSRYQKEGEFDPKFSSSGHGEMQMSEVNIPANPWKQDLIPKVREQDEEIMQLHKHLVDYSVKEAQMRNEKYVLEKRIASMRRAFDQQQQDLVDATSKALSYRQDVIEENIRLTYALQAAEQERSTFVSYLLPLLAEYNLQPPVSDAQSIVSNLKVLFKHLQEKLIITEEKLKESQYQVTPWRSDVLNNTNFPSQQAALSFGSALNTSKKNSLEIVPQPGYIHAQMSNSSPSNAQTTRDDWESVGNHGHHPGLGGFASKRLDRDNLGRPSPSGSRKSMAQDTAKLVVTLSDSHVTSIGEEKNNRPPFFNEFIASNEMDRSDAGLQNAREPPPQWGSRGPYVMNTADDPNPSLPPYLPPVLEEPSSSFSEAAEDDPLPGIRDLQINGQAFPGQELQACGYSINGTTSCNFEWVRYLEDGSVNYIIGAKQPNYLVTADDVDFCLAIEVQPLDDRKRKGELVKVFANEHQKITCDPEMQEQIEKSLSVGRTSFEVKLSAGCLDIWERAVLAIKREAYSIKCNGPRGVVVTEKFSPSTSVTIPYGEATGFIIYSSNGTGYLLQTLGSSSLRDTIVLTLRLFKMRAVEKKGKRRGLFFNR